MECTPKRRLRTAAAVILVATTSPAFAQQLTFNDATVDAGLGGINAARLCFADLDGDGQPDAIVRAIETKDGKPSPDRYRVFLNRKKEPVAGGLSFSFVEMTTPTGLPTPQAGDCLVFADLDNDGHADAIFTRYLDINNPKFVEPPAPARTCWLKGKGDGTFGEPQIIEAAKRATTACIAVGDVNRDGGLDLYLGNWYTKYGESNEAFTNDLILQTRGGSNPATVGFVRNTLPEDDQAFDEQNDVAGRPTYGAMFTPWGILEINYGRRANRLWRIHRFVSESPLEASCEIQQYVDPDLAPLFGLDGDNDRSGKYPDWLKERAKTDKRFDREDEKPYRSNGIGFDAAIGDIDNDGKFDVFLAMITHGWAGPSADRSRFLVNRLNEESDENPLGGAGPSRFVENHRLSVDRLPADPTIRNWNQGDMFAELADFDNDGRLDLLLSSGDYPDDQHLRLYRQQDDGRFVDITPWTGINNEGSLQVSLADVDGDGDMDILVGESFNRLNAAQIAGRTPSIKLYLNQTVEKRQARLDQGLSLDGVVRSSVTLHLVGDPSKGVSRDALGATVTADVNLDGNQATPPTTIIRQLIGIGGHAGKQHEFLIHIPLAAAAKADKIVIEWPGQSVPDTVLTDVDAGHYDIELSEPKKDSPAKPREH